jgi:hypothetical protein
MYYHLRGILLLFILSLSLGIASDYAAVVGSVTVDLKEFDRQFYHALNEYRQLLFLEEADPIDNTEIDQLKYSVLNDMIDSTLISSYAEGNKVYVDELEVKQEIIRLQQGFPDKKTFLDALNTQGVQLSQLVKNIKDQALRNKVVSSLFPGYDQISTSDVFAYLKERHMMATPVQYDLTILVTENGSYLDEIVRSDVDLSEKWPILGLDSGSSYLSILMLEADLPDNIADVVLKSKKGTFSTVRVYDLNQVFVVRVNDVIHVQSKEAEVISKAIMRSMKEEKKNRILSTWLQNQRNEITFNINQEVFPEFQKTKNSYEQEIFDGNQLEGALPIS